jgi:hypothetical protein
VQAECVLYCTVGLHDSPLGMDGAGIDVMMFVLFWTFVAMPAIDCSSCFAVVLSIQDSALSRLLTGSSCCLAALICMLLCTFCAKP